MKDLKIPFYQILEILKNEITDKYKKIDFIVPMPSKHNLSLQLARRLQRQFHQSIVLEDLLIKKSNREMSEEVANSDIPNTDKHLILQRIKQAEQRNKLFSVSDIPPPIRKYVHPIKLNETQIVEHGIYIIVDDLISTACTLSSAQQVLVSNSAEIDILAVSLFSPVNNRIKET
nr:phosphoribosyltransferase family protein [Acinetobacter sp. YH12233]